MSLFFCCPSACPGSPVSPGFLVPFVVLRRIQNSIDDEFISENSLQLRLCFLFLQPSVLFSHRDPMYCTPHTHTVWSWICVHSPQEAPLDIHGELRLAVEGMRVDTVRQILEHADGPALVRHADADGHTLLHLAAMTPPGDAACQMSAVLLSFGATVNSGNLLGETALTLATRSVMDHAAAGERLRLLKLLFDALANVNVTDAVAGDCCERGPPHTHCLVVDLRTSSFQQLGNDCKRWRGAKPFFRWGLAVLKRPAHGLMSYGTTPLQRTVSFSGVVVLVHPPEPAHHTPSAALPHLIRVLAVLGVQAVSLCLGFLQVSAVSFDVTSCCCTMTHERDRVMCWSFSLPVCGTVQAFAASVVARIGSCSVVHIQDSKGGGKRSGRTGELQYLPHTSSGCPVVILDPPGPLRCVAQNPRTQLTSEFGEFIPATACVFSHVFLLVIRCTEYCHPQCVSAKPCQQRKPHQL